MTNSNPNPPNPPNPNPKPAFGSTLAARLGGLAQAASRAKLAEKSARLEQTLENLLPHLTTRLTNKLANPPTAYPAMHTLEIQIEAIDKAMAAEGLTPANWRDLTQAKSKLLEAWCHLAGIPKPIDHHKGNAKTRSARLPAMPIAPEAHEPQADQPLELPETTTGSVPESADP